MKTKNIDMWGPQRVTAILVINRVWFLNSSLDMGMFFTKNTVLVHHHNGRENPFTS